MVDPISTSGAATTSLLSQSLGKNKELGRDAFLKLLVAQLKNQDPLKPQDSAEFVAELAQFSNLEQTMGINERLDVLSVQNSGLQNAQVIGMVGKQATVRGGLITSDGSGVGVPVSFSLSGATEETVVTIRDQYGRAVRTLDLGGRDAGLTKIHWDGRDDAGNVQPAGTYSVAVRAGNAEKSPIQVSQETAGRVQAVSFDKGYPVIHLETGVSVPVSDLIRVDSPTAITP